MDGEISEPDLQRVLRGNELHGAHQDPQGRLPPEARHMGLHVRVHDRHARPADHVALPEILPVASGAVDRGECGSGTAVPECHHLQHQPAKEGQHVDGSFPGEERGVHTRQRRHDLRRL
ncbi:hypothetical protein DPMN_069104 [Dreissena polymorpha]|uniref:Uncharacterized protein n=1 Tax=Dreissena polymorpha TaxID=45954 RepID=A0A9D4BU31_DREPO|nr:hypothetical protein DPMN_069104 [Dreissena polymorpha]